MYTDFRNFVTGQLRLSKMVYYEHELNAAKNDIKQTWRVIGNIINTENRKIKNIVKKIIQDVIVHEDSEDRANMFNDYFLFYYITLRIYLISASGLVYLCTAAWSAA